MVRLAAVVVFCALVTAVLAEGCGTTNLDEVAEVYSSSCSYTFGTSTYDLTRLQKNNYWHVYVSDKKWNWYMNVCKKVSDVGCTTAYCDGNGVCQKEASGEERCFGCGLANTIAVTAHPDGNDKGFVLRYTNGDAQDHKSRDAAIQFDCTTGSDSFQYTGENRISATEIEYDFTFGSKKACPTGIGSGGGWVFLLIVVIALIVYFGAGILYKRAQLGATGMECVPNIDFWRELPGLVKDGCIFFWEKMRTLFGRSGYSGI